MIKLKLGCKGSHFTCNSCKKESHRICRVLQTSIIHHQHPLKDTMQQMKNK